MVVKIVAGVLGVLVIGVGAFVYHNYNNGCCSTETVLTTTEVCPCDAVEANLCCQQPSRGSLVSVSGCCAEVPVSTLKDGQEILSIEPREVK